VNARGLLLLMCALLAAGPAAGDEETARYFLSRARRALEAEQFDDAEKFLKRSLEEQKDYAPALLAFAELCKRRGQRRDAIRHLEACIAQKSREYLDSEERKAIEAAEKTLETLDRARVEYQRLIDGHIAKLLELGASSARKKPDLARECYRTILLLAPGHEEAKRRLGSVRVPRAGGKPLFNGKDLEQWTGKAPVWTVRNGVLRGAIADAANINRYKSEIGGDFTLECELRVVKAMGTEPVCGILFGLRGPYDHFGLWIWPQSWCLERKIEEYKRSELQRRSFSRFVGKFDPFGWHVYRIVRKGKRITGYVDGQKLWSFAGPDRTLDGFVGLWVQEREIEVRRFTLEQ
jgi:tetratricopeptide (TPR) repeat protein